jgi:hypothetical protein
LVGFLDPDGVKKSDGVGGVVPAGSEVVRAGLVLRQPESSPCGSDVVPPGVSCGFSESFEAAEGSDGSFEAEDSGLSGVDDEDVDVDDVDEDADEDADEDEEGVVDEAAAGAGDTSGAPDTSARMSSRRRRCSLLLMVPAASSVSRRRNSSCQDIANSPERCIARTP